jgi:hypothetical protein
VITIKGTYLSSLVTLTSDHPFVISKPFLRDGQRYIPFSVRIPSNSGSGSADHFKAFYHDLFVKFAFLNPLFSV